MQGSSSSLYRRYWLVAILDQLEALGGAGILDVYVQELNASTRNLSSNFWEPTERGDEILYEHNFLRGVPIAGAVYEVTQKSERIRRHEAAPRPTFPEAVRETSNSTNRI